MRSRFFIIIREHRFFFAGLFFVLLTLCIAIGTAWYVREMIANAPYNVVMLPDAEDMENPLEFGALPSLENPGFFAKVRERFIDGRQTFIEADLSAMKLMVYQDGVVVKEAAILSKGRVGSWWETPAGIYRVESKVKNHFSGFGHVYQPWSMAFQGNFFIHGWPYYPNGDPVPEGYSGGCVRLSTEDAEQIFGIVKVGTPVLVFEKKFDSDGFREEIKKPVLSSRNYLVADLKSNYVFLSQSSTEPVSIASLTKLITAAVATEYMNIERNINITESMIATTTKPRLKAEDSFSVYDLLFPLLMESSNEAARALSYPLGPQRFIELMDQKAKAVGMESTTFEDPAGMKAGNVASAEDLFRLAKYLYNNRSFLLKLTTGRLKTATYGEPAFGDLGNFNIFFDDPSFVGGKIGKSAAAQEAMLAIFELPVNGTVRPVALIVLQSEKCDNDVRNILEWIKKLY